MSHTPIIPVSALKGAPASILWVMALYRQPMTVQHLVSLSGYKRDAVMQGLRRLHALSLVERHTDFCWKLSHQGIDLVQAGHATEPLTEKATPGRGESKKSRRDAGKRGRVPGDESGFSTRDRQTPGRGISARAEKSTPGEHVPAGSRPPESKNATPSNRESNKSIQQESVVVIDPLNREENTKTTITASEDADFRAAHEQAEPGAAEVRKALLEAGIVINKRVRRLIGRPYLTPGYVRAHHQQLIRQGKGQSTGLLVTILESGVRAPALNGRGHLLDCVCEECLRQAYAWQAKDSLQAGGETEPWEATREELSEEPLLQTSLQDGLTLGQAWERLMRVMSDEVDLPTFRSRFAPLRLVGWRDNTLLVQAPSPFEREYLDQYWNQFLTRMLAGIAPQSIKIRFVNDG